MKFFWILLTCFFVYIGLFMAFLTQFFREFAQRSMLSNIVTDLHEAAEAANPYKLLEYFNELENESIEYFSEPNKESLLLIKNTFREIMPKLLVSVIRDGEPPFAFSKLVQIMLEIIQKQSKPSKRFSDLVENMSTNLIKKDGSSNIIAQLTNLASTIIAENDRPPRKFSELARLVSK